MRTLTKMLVIGVLPLLAVPLYAGPASSRLVEGDLVMSEDQPSHRRTFPNIPEGKPATVFDNQVTPGSEVYRECIKPEATWCAVTTVRWQPRRANGHETWFTIGWDGSGGGSLTMILYDPPERDDEEAVAMQQTSGGQPPQSISPIPDLPRGTYHLAVFGSGNAGEYWIQGDASFVEIGSSGGGEEGDDRPQSTGAPAGGPSERTNRTPRPTASTSSSAAGDPTTAPEDIAMPGEDGPTGEFDVPVVAAGRQAGPPVAGGNLLKSVLAGLLIGGVVVGGGLFVALRIRKDVRSHS